MAVGEIILAAFIQTLFERLASADLWNFARRERIHTLLAKWSRMLGKKGAVQADAEEKQMTDERGMKLQWLENLKDLAYDINKVLDEFNIEALRQKVMEEPQASTSKVRAILPTSCTSFKPSTVLPGFRMSSQIDEITDRLQVLFDRTTGLGMKNLVAGSSAKAPQRPPTSSLIHEPRLYGRHENAKKIIELFLINQLSNSNVDVVPIVGMDGVGKTTLAQMVYYHEMVDKHFEMKAWVCVSKVFDIMGVTKAILEDVTKQSCNFQALAQIQVQLKEALGGKKFLIVLDDVWNKNRGDWSTLKSPFNDGAPGSKVIVITHNTDVALMIAETNKFHSLKELSDEDCWSVFAQHAFENKSIDETPNLASIGKKIVKKCRGLPLAARMLGGLLRCKLRDDEWNEVLNNKIWELSVEESDILPALRLSYYYLPSHLKKCFAYCSELPKDYEFEEKELVQPIVQPTTYQTRALVAATPDLAPLQSVPSSHYITFDSITLGKGKRKLSAEEEAAEIKKKKRARSIVSSGFMYDATKSNHVKEKPLQEIKMAYEPHFDKEESIQPHQKTNRSKLILLSSSSPEKDSVPQLQGSIPLPRNSMVGKATEVLQIVPLDLEIASGKITQASSLGIINPSSTSVEPIQENNHALPLEVTTEETTPAAPKEDDFILSSSPSPLVPVVNETNTLVSPPSVNGANTNPKAGYEDSSDDEDLVIVLNRMISLSRSLTHTPNPSSMQKSIELDEHLQQDLNLFHDLLELSFEEVTSNSAASLQACLSRLAAISYRIFTVDEQATLLLYLESLSSNLTLVHYHSEELKSKQDLIDKVANFSATVSTKCEAVADLKSKFDALDQEEKEKEIREQMVILQLRLTSVQERKINLSKKKSALKREMKDLLANVTNSSVVMNAAYTDLRRHQLALDDLRNKWNQFRSFFKKEERTLL